jgi:hypothetical protein
METKNPQALKAGWGMADITPPRTSELYGQYYQRIAKKVRDPLSVTALALEKEVPGGSPQQAIFVSCDQAMVDRTEVIQPLRDRIRTQLADFDPSMLIVSATHTHSAPTSSDPLQWWTHDPKYLPPSEYKVILLHALETAVVQAWRSRGPASAGSTAGFASVGHCRRPMYADGSAQMYGTTDRPDFIGMEGGEDDTIGVIGLYDAKGALTGFVVNVVCPSQVMEATSVVTADMYGEMRRLLRERYGAGIHVLCHIGAAGDMAPRDLAKAYRGGPTFWDEAGLEILGARLAAAVIEAAPRAEAARASSPVFLHETFLQPLPLRTVSLEAYARAAAEYAALVAREPADPTSPQSAYARFVKKTRERESLPVPGPYDDKNDDFVLMRNLEALIRRFQDQDGVREHPTEVHVLRLGDLALATSPFELYLDYGLRIKARSPAALTLHAQLSGGTAGYLATARAITAGGYGALVANGPIGPDGGQMLVEAILSTLRRMFAS